MPSLETFGLRQNAVLWPYAGKDGYGQPLIGAPVELLVRWTEKPHIPDDPMVTAIQYDGNAVVDRDIDLESIMWLGRLADWNGTGPVMEVKGFSKIVSIRGTRFRRIAYFIRYRGPLPAVAV